MNLPTHRPTDFRQRYQNKSGGKNNFFPATGARAAGYLSREKEKIPGPSEPCKTPPPTGVTRMGHGLPQKAGPGRDQRHMEEIFPSSEVGEVS